MLIQEHPNLVGYWRFDKGSGKFAMDLTGNGNHGRLMDMVPWN